MTADPIYFEMFDEDTPPRTRGEIAKFPLLPFDRESYPFEKSSGEAELWAAQLQHRHFVAEMLGTEAFAKRVPPGLIDITPSAVRPPVNPNSSYRQEPLPAPEEADVRLCECKCEKCLKGECKSCEAEQKCDFWPRSQHQKAIARLCDDARNKLLPLGQDRHLWEALEAAMERFVTKAVASVG